ncbi:MAG: MoaD/ThiS family protein [Bacillota bacterium]
MKVTVRLYATLAGYNPEGTGNQPFTVDLPEGSAVNDLVNHLGVEVGAVKHVFIGHKRRSFDYRLSDGEEVALFPAIAGG